MLVLSRGARRRTHKLCDQASQPRGTQRGFRRKANRMTYEYWPTFRALDPSILPGFEGEAAGGAGTAGVSVEQVEAMIKKAVPDINTIVNNAVANLKNKDLPKIIDDRINPVNETLKTIGTTLETLVSTNGSGSNGAGSGTNGAAAAGAGGGANGSANSNMSPEVHAELKALRTNFEATKLQVKALEEGKKLAEENAERSDRHGKIKMALSGMQFANDRAGETAFQIVEPQVKRQDDGTVIGGDNLPLEVFFRDFITREHPYLLKGTGAAGAGASGGGGGTGRGAVTADISMIKPGMTPQERQLVLAAITSATQAKT